MGKTFDVDGARFVSVGLTGDAKLAIFEKSTGEPLQYVVTDPRMAGRLAESWEETLSAKAVRASQRESFGR